MKCYSYFRSSNSQNFHIFSKLKRILWWLFAIGFTGIFGWECYQTIVDYIEQPYIIIQTEVENSSVELPIIRICPSTWINYTAVKEQNVTLEQLEMLMVGFVESFLEDNDRVNKSYLEQSYNQFIEDRPDFDIQRFFRQQISFKCPEIFRYCRWQRENLDCCEGENDLNDSKKPLTSAGQCYLIKKGRLQQNDTNFEQSVPGPGGGLMIHMALPHEKSEFPNLTYHVSSAQGIIVNTQNGPQPTFTNPIAIPLGHEALMSISARKTVRVHNCNSGLQKMVFITGSGSKKACLLECLINATLAKCNCTFFTYSLAEISRDQYCNPIQFVTCIKPLISNTKPIEEECIKAGKCFQECETWEYLQTVSISPIHPGRFESKLKRIGYLPLDFKQVVNIRVFFPAIGWQLIKEVETQTPHSFISNIGGQLGLWLGFSMLSLIISVLDVICIDSTGKTVEMSVEQRRAGPRRIYGTQKVAPEFKVAVSKSTIF